MSETISDPVPRFQDLNETEQELVQRLRRLGDPENTYTLDEFRERLGRT